MNTTTTANRHDHHEDEFWTERQLADYLAFSTRTIRRWRRAGLIPAVKLPSGRGHRYRVSAIDRAIQSWETP